MSRRVDAPRLGVAAGLLTALAAVIIGLHWAGRFDLGGPSSWTADGLRAWADDPVLVVATAARWIALGLAYYLTAVLVALTVSGDSEKIGRVVPRKWIVPLAALLGIGVVAVTAAGSSGGASPAVSASLRLQTSSAPLVLEPTTPDPVPQSSVVRPPAPGPGAPISPTTPVTTSVAATDDTVIVEPGDSIWALACDSLVEAWDRPVTDAEIVPYWRTMIEANLDRLVEPGNPDLILPGQQLLIPDAPNDPAGE